MALPRLVSQACLSESWPTGSSPGERSLHLSQQAGHVTHQGSGMVARGPGRGASTKSGRSQGETWEGAGEPWFSQASGWGYFSSGQHQRADRPPPVDHQSGEAPPPRTLPPSNYHKNCAAFGEVASSPLSRALHNSKSSEPGSETDMFVVTCRTSAPWMVLEVSWTSKMASGLTL